MAVEKVTANPAGPLAALLARHPEECAAAVALLALGGDGFLGIRLDVLAARMHDLAKLPLSLDHARDIVNVLISEGVIAVNAWGEFRIAADADRYAIARMGAAAWLRERVAVSAADGDNHGR